MTEMTDTVPGRQPDAAAPNPGGLKFAEQLLIWAMRVWMQAHGREAGSSHYHFGILRTSFELAGIAEALAVFDRLMTAIVVSRRRDIGLHFPKCRGVSADELMMLGIVAGAQRGDPVAVGLDALVGLSAVPTVGAAAREFAACLARRGMVVRTLETAPAGGRPAEPVGTAPAAAAPARTIH